MKSIMHRVLCVLLIISLLPAVFVGAGERFSDVSDTAWYARAVAYAADSGKMVGVGNSLFAPNTEVSRAMLAAVLYRLDGGNLSFDTPSFSDNAKDAWYFDGIEYCASNGIVFGYGDGTFGVQDLLTREDMMTMFYRYAVYHSLVTDSSEAYHTDYLDGNTVSSYAVAAVNWCLQEGVVSGTSYTTLSPKDTASRAQLAQILLNYAESVLGEDLRQYRKSEDNPYGIGVVATRLYKDKFSFRLTGLEDSGEIEMTVRYHKGEEKCAEQSATIAADACRYDYEGDASTLSFTDAMNAGLAPNCFVEIELLEEGNAIFTAVVSLGNLLQKAPDGAALYFKGEREMDCRILLYHHFVTFDPLPESYGSVSTPERFEENLRYIIDNGYSVIPLQFLIDYNAGKRALPAKSVIITFDDGYESNYTLIYPILQKYSAPATIFVVTDTMNQSGKMTWDQMREMEQSGLVDIQNHSFRHHDHSTLSEKELHSYFSTSFETLEKQLGAEKNRILAYPHGKYNDKTIALAKQYDVRMQMTTHWKALNMKALQLDRLPRINVEHTASIEKLLKVSK